MAADNKMEVTTTTKKTIRENASELQRSTFGFLSFFEHFQPTEEGVKRVQSLNTAGKVIGLKIRPAYREGVMRTPPPSKSQSSPPSSAKNTLASSGSQQQKPPLETITSIAVNCNVKKEEKDEKQMEVEVSQQVKQKINKKEAQPNKRASSSDSGCCSGGGGKDKKRKYKRVKIEDSDDEDDKVVVQFDSDGEGGEPEKEVEEEEENKPKPRREKVETTMEVDDGEFKVTKLSDKSLETGCGKKKMEEAKEAHAKSNKPASGGPKPSSQKAVPKNQTSIMSFFKKATPK